MPNSQVRQRVRWLVTAFGPSIAANPNQLDAGLADLALASPEDVRLIVTAARAGVARELAVAAREHRADLVAQASEWMASESDVSPKTAEWALETWAVAFEGLPQVAPSAQAISTGTTALAERLPIAEEPAVASPEEKPSPAPWESTRTELRNGPWTMSQSPTASWGMWSSEAAALSGVPVEQSADSVAAGLGQLASARSISSKAPPGPWNCPGYAGPPPCAWPRRDYPAERAPWANTSGADGPIPPEIAALKWNWGAFGLPFFWFAAHGLWPFSLAWLAMGAGIGFLPGGVVSRTLVVIVVQVLCGLFGNKLAWINRPYESVDHFHTVERIWMFWGVALSILEIAVYALVLLGGSNTSQ